MPFALHIHRCTSHPNVRRTACHAAAAAALLAAAGCSTEPPEVTSQADEQLCRRETPLGTSIPALRCRSRERAERDRDAVDALAEELRGKSAVSTEFGGRP